LRLHVEADGLVWLSLPTKTPRADAVKLVRRHRRWLGRRLAQVTAPSAPPRLWGQPLRDDVRGPALEALYRRELTQAVSELLARWAPLAGQAPSRVTLRWMKTRWGSCSRRGRRVSLNVALAALPPALVELVVVHELTHLTVPDHSPRFWAKLSSLLPDLEARRAALRGLTPIPRPAAATEAEAGAELAGRGDPEAGRAVQGTLY
jgi:predicted metal-dependent hydrolase